ncbi:flagellar basal body P-ring formation protein FlgA [Duganella sp. LX47W]|uniref:Flagella basal body P-ring formation protein FlgA n=2 Tax=Rugamonas apoptosis TaxID=2758570 RepID=A0A7W2FBY9_9BURK|nr:flagellar basal body P-ring formation protein FlgA [Rugamonas apoptosis]
MRNKTIVTRFAPMLLNGILMVAAAAPVGPEQMLLHVQQAARSHVLAQAASAGLAEPQAEVTVLRGSRPLAACGRAVTVEAVDARMPARMRFAAVCPGADGWRYEFVVRAQVSAPVVVSATEVPAGKVLTDEDVLLERHELSSLTDVVATPRAVLGMSGKRTLRAGEVLRMALLAAPTVVKRGDAVTIVARRDQIEVSMAGEALDSGARGALVRVRNANGTVLRARVTGAGTVEPADLPATSQSPD